MVNKGMSINPSAHPRRSITSLYVYLLVFVPLSTFEIANRWTSQLNVYSKCRAYDYFNYYSVIIVLLHYNSLHTEKLHSYVLTREPSFSSLKVTHIVLQFLEVPTLHTKIHLSKSHSISPHHPQAKRMKLHDFWFWTKPKVASKCLSIKISFKKTLASSKKANG